MPGRWIDNPYQALAHAGRPQLAELGWDLLRHCTHGDLAGWLQAIDALPVCEPLADLNRAAPKLGGITDQPELLHKNLFRLHPWRKGPLEPGGVFIDTEWRSDWKWQRIAEHLDLEGKRVLDIGCGNGYFGLRMLGDGARLVVGIDPTIVFVMQWLAIQKLCPGLQNYVLPMGIEQLPDDTEGFDVVFSMGVLYHRRKPLEHLQQLKALTLPGGQILLETLVVEGSETLIPKGRYARMRNVHALPTIARLESWLDEAGLPRHKLLDVSKTSLEEQRTTAWMTFQSLRQSLDEDDISLTVEGHPAPVRAVVLIKA